LRTNRIGLQSLPDVMHRPPAELELTRQRQRRFAFADATQQQDDLGGTHMFTRKDRATVERIHTLTAQTTINRQPTACEFTKDACLVHLRSAVRTLQPMRMEIFQQPCCAVGFIEQLHDRKFHEPILAPYIHPCTFSAHEPSSLSAVRLQIPRRIITPYPITYEL